MGMGWKSPDECTAIGGGQFPTRTSEGATDTVLNKRSGIISKWFKRVFKVLEKKREIDYSYI